MTIGYKIFLLYLLLLLPTVKAPVPGYFFWKPRLGLRLGSEVGPFKWPPTKENIKSGKVKIIDGYSVSLIALAFVSIFDTFGVVPHMNPLKAPFYTNAYRWTLRHLSLIPRWLGNRMAYADTHKLWRRRYYFMDKFVPKWMRYALPWVSKDEWDKEQKAQKKFMEASANLNPANNFRRNEDNYLLSRAYSDDNVLDSDM